MRAGARRYAALLALPGARRPVIASAIGSMPIGMFGLAVLLLAQDATGSFAIAGRVVGAFGIGNALGAVAQGRLMDRLGQTRVLRTAAVAHALACAALVVVAHEGAATGWLYASAVLGGLALPQLPAAMRSLWSVLARDQEQRETAYAMVSIVFEIAVLTAPALTAAIVVLASPEVAVARRGDVLRRRRARVLLHAGLAGVAGRAARRRLARAAGRAGHAHRAARPGRVRDRGRRRAGAAARVRRRARVGGDRRPLPRAALRGLARRRARLRRPLVARRPGAAAPAADARARRRLRAARRRRPRACSRCCCSAAGCVLAPTTVVASTLLDTAAPAGTVTEAFAVMVMGIVAGTALGNALGGAIVEGASYEAGALCAGAIALLGCRGSRSPAGARSSDGPGRASAGAEGGGGAVCRNGGARAGGGALPGGSSGI